MSATLAIEKNFKKCLRGVRFRDRSGQGPTRPPSAKRQKCQSLLAMVLTPYKTYNICQSLLAMVLDSYKTWNLCLRAKMLAM